MTNLTRHFGAFWQAALVLVSGCIVPLCAQEADTQHVRAASQSAAPKVARYVHTLLERHDRNGDGRLEPAEWQRMQGSPQAIDHNQDGVLVESELLAHVMAYARARMPVRPALSGDDAFSTEENLPPPDDRSEGNASSARSRATTIEGAAANDGAARNEDGSQGATKFVVRPSRATHNLPEWFLGRDADGDRQLTLREFGADSPGRSREFDRLDRNGDGLLTPQEVTAPPSEGIGNGE